MKKMERLIDFISIFAIAIVFIFMILVLTLVGTEVAIRIQELTV